MKTMGPASGFQDADEQSGLRRAALYLHALHVADRAFLLEQLAPSDRERLEGLLNELKVLGFPADREWAQLATVEPSQAVDLAASHDRMPGVSTDVATVALMAASPAVIGPVLLAEPDALVAQVLASRPWPWRDAVLQNAGVSRRRTIAEHLQEQPAAQPERLAAALLGALFARVNEAVSAATCVTQERPRFARWTARMAIVTAWAGRAVGHRGPGQ
jgi:hypothetical protein